ncbi:MAG: pili assembly chaperone [Gammaproteobacteria bacterium]|nr:pili assembly chaperone [Gammaproteobacteria bacterium]MCP5417419.1 pili assembly chaperone [Chromatiaceae bacterium]
MDMNRHSPFPSLPRQQFALALAALITVNGAFADEVQVGRYASVQAVPTSAQVHLLSAMVRVQFPASVVSVGQAVEHLLQPSGYRLASEAAVDPLRKILLNLPLPEPHRTLGPMPLQTALETLAGPAFRLVEDPVHRLVSFERCGPINNGQPSPSNFEAR